MQTEKVEFEIIETVDMDKLQTKILATKKLAAAAANPKQFVK